MATYRDEGVFPLPRDQLWKFLELHTRDDVISHIHKGVLEQRTISASSGEFVLARTLDARGKRCPVTWKITYRPPDRARWEIVEAPHGPMTVGSHLENRYSVAPGGTMVHSEIDITLSGVPGLFQKRIVKSVVNTIDTEDRAYLQARPQV